MHDHEGVKYQVSRQQGTFIATHRQNLVGHIQSKHGVVKYPCDQCDSKATCRKDLYRHIKSKQIFL